jgi:hypothetical protein
MVDADQRLRHGIGRAWGVGRKAGAIDKRAGAVDRGNTNGIVHASSIAGP